MPKSVNSVHIFIFEIFGTLCESLARPFKRPDLKRSVCDVTRVRYFPQPPRQQLGHNHKHAELKAKNYQSFRRNSVKMHITLIVMNRL